ncbi:CBU_0592 family membrane protein [Cognatiyoonia sp. IB215182]|uniref:CBU_0592 family membrane protein n=1 Tax=Cognatiyoonia sp. IB215182 TaxID=3097353 RepID=UPI002A0DDD51|nr:hypothetical protein [Cognatiyoonia sp. IB215182]MDX8351091.1 hypothetical protein [Cognatiyoonia sp. IB215182]
MSIWQPGVADAIGVAGFGLYVLNYTLLTFRRIRTEYVVYFVINAAAASMVLIGLSASFNLASALIQVFWLIISLTAIVIRLRGQAPPGRLRARRDAPP